MSDDRDLGVSAPRQATLEKRAPITERVRARIDLAAVEGNCRHLRSLLHGSTALCAVVKADGYGHGAVACAQAAQRAGAAWLAVATAGEAAGLRQGNISGPLLVMGALTPAELAQAVAARADIVAWTPGFVAAAGAGARSAGVRVGVHVKLDTGMGRLGTKDPVEARRLADSIACRHELDLAGAMTHFATADDPGDSYFPVQLDRFASFARELKAIYPRLLTHAANSAATYRDRASHFALVRCGIAMYGLDPFQDTPADRGLEPALSLESYVASVKRFDPGETAGYGRRWRAGSEPGWACCRSATVTVGGAPSPTTAMCWCAGGGGRS
jgi:alanine racemase